MEPDTTLLGQLLEEGCYVENGQWFDRLDRRIYPTFNSSSNYRLDLNGVADAPNNHPTQPPLEENIRAKILRTAEELVNGDRAQTYGSPEVSFGRIANLWSAMDIRIKTFSPAFIGDFDYRELDAVDVALCLMQLKVSRILSSPDHEDSWVDAAGYAGLGAELALRKD